MIFSLLLNRSIYHGIPFRRSDPDADRSDGNVKVGYMTTSWLLAWLSPPDWDSFLSDLDLGLGGWRFGAMQSWELAFE